MPGDKTLRELAREYLGGATESAVGEEIDRISERLRSIYASSDETGESTNTVADRVAQSIVRKAARQDSRLIA